MNRITNVYSLELLRWSLSQPYNRRRASAGPGAWCRTAQPATNNVRAPAIASVGAAIQAKTVTTNMVASR
jgi:hypothetical protein